MDKQTYEFISKQTNDPIIERRKCKILGQDFPIFQGDVNLLEKFAITIGSKKYNFPLPNLSPKIRQLIRYSFVNYNHLYSDVCDLTGKKTISRFPPESDMKVYTTKAWASDERDYCDYGLDYNGEEVFSYIDKLMKITPYQDLIGSLSNIENNATYTNYTADVSDCYLIFDSNRTEKSCYSTKSRKSKYVFDCLGIGDSENCYECIDCKGMYKTNYCYISSDCNNSDFLIDCHGCNFCMFSTNLNNKEYYVFNKPVSKQEYQAIKNKLISESYNSSKFSERENLKSSIINKNINILGSENSVGENIRFSSNVFFGSNIVDSQNLRYCDSMEGSQDCLDTDSYGHDSFLMFNSTQVGRYSNHIYLSALIGKSDNLIYCVEAKKSKNCFGCVNIKEKEYCIFNKQYTKEEYEEIVPHLMEKLINQGLWGDFLPTEMSLFPYNDSFSHYLYPAKYLLIDGETKVLDPKGNGTITVLNSNDFISDAILDFGGDEKLKIKWRNGNKEINVPKGIDLIDAKDLPQDISTINYNDILNKAVVCEKSGRPFRIVKMELDFYTKNNLPLPKRHPDIRHLDRMKKRSGNNLNLIKCGGCNSEMLSVYSKDDTSKIFCPKCYDQKVI